MNPWILCYSVSLWSIRSSPPWPWTVKKSFSAISWAILRLCATSCYFRLSSTPCFVVVFAIEICTALSLVQCVSNAHPFAKRFLHPLSLNLLPKIINQMLDIHWTWCWKYRPWSDFWLATNITTSLLRPYGLRPVAFQLTLSTWRINHFHRPLDTDWTPFVIR